MIIFGINLPLAEFFFLIIILLFVFLVMILMQLKKLQKMTSDERKELEELEKLAQQEKADISEIKDFEKGFEARQEVDLSKFESEILELEKSTDTMYIKNMAPDLYKIQNYTLWAIKKGLSVEQIKKNLLGKGWKDDKLIEMIIDDILKYTGYYKENKGDVKVPNVHIKETTKVIKPVHVVTVEKKVEIVKKEPTKKKTSKKKKTTKKKSSKKKPKKKTKKVNLATVEKELQKLETDLKKESKKTGVKKSTKKKPAKKKTPTKKKSTKKKSNKKKSTKKKPKTPVTKK